MTTTYEVWDMESANQVGSFRSETEARTFLEDMLRLNGADAVRALSVAAVEYDDSGVLNQKRVLEGPDFLAELEQGSHVLDRGRTAS